MRKKYVNKIVSRHVYLVYTQMTGLYSNEYMNLEILCVTL